MNESDQLQTVSSNPAECEDAPRVALIGWCERATEITDGHPVFWHRHILGVSATRVFNIFPIDLRGLQLAVCFYNPSHNESVRIIFRKVQNPDSWFEMTLQLSIESVHKMDGSSASGELDVKPGWVLGVSEIENRVSIDEPASYEVFLRTQKHGEQYLGRVHFIHAAVAPFSAEDYAAIKSDPLAAKLIRMQLACKLCGDAFRTYTGLERSDKLENNGWLWQADLGDRFTCKCGKSNIDLKYIKTGLHGLLRRRLNPVATEKYDTVRLYEKTALEQQLRDFESVLNTANDEAEIQQFLEQHDIFFHRFYPLKILKKPKVLTSFVADFAVLNERKELLLIEIERTNMPLIKPDGGVRAELTHAVDQTRSWMVKFDDHRAAALDALGLGLDQVARVRSVVIAGRTPKDETLARMIRTLSWTDVEFLTFDDLKYSVAEVVRHIASV